MAMSVKDCNDISSGLCDWFESQDIDPSHGMTAMAYLIGVMSAHVGKDMEETMSLCDITAAVSKAVAKQAFLKKIN